MKLRTRYANELLGLKLSESQIIECLEKSRLGAEKVEHGIIEVTIPSYRIDILHEVDLVEEVVIGYGYYNLKPTFPSSVTIGKQHPANKTANIARQIMVGLGFTEVMNFTLTNEQTHYEKMRLETANTTVKLTNPVSSEYTVMRRNLLPGLIKNLADNKHESFPQNIFEASDVVWLNDKTETGCERRLHVAAVSSHTTASFTESKSAAEALLTNMGIKRWKIKATKHPSFIEGRAVTINIKAKWIGIVGEVHPQVLNNFELDLPTTAFEVDLEPWVK
jgi:phenylalanyl-tRNA synthetase beta chain